MENELTRSVPIIDLIGLYQTTETFVTRNFTEVIVVLAVLFVLWNTYRNRRKTTTVPAGEARRRTWRDLWKALKLKLWYTPRAAAMSKKRFRAREKMMQDLVTLHQVLATEQLYVKGWITREFRDKCVNDIAFRFSNPQWFTEGRLKIIKAKIKAHRKELGLPMTLDAAGFPKSIEPEARPPVVEEREGKKTLFTKAA